jgi:hypothetical protein
MLKGRLTEFKERRAREEESWKEDREGGVKEVARGEGKVEG